MKRVLSRLWVVFGALALVSVIASSLAVGQEATPEATMTVVERYDHVTLRAEVDRALYRNPFDPDDIEVIGIFNGPSGDQVVVPGFWIQPYANRCQTPCTTENLQPDGEAEWQVRFTPGEVGTWDYLLQVLDDGDVVSTTDGEFEVAPSERRGFIRVAPNQRYFEYDNGEPYFVVGHNLNWSWAGSGGVSAYERWLESLAASGGNYARVYVDAPWFIGLEWDRLGDYRSAQDDAARLDRLLELAEERGIALQLVLVWSQSLRTYVGAPVSIPRQPARPDTSADWDDNPYNVANGGPVNRPAQFFSDATAAEYFRRRLRYIVARWGYSPNIFAWEMMDEIDTMNAAAPDVKNRWLEEMAVYLRQIDPQHLITAGSREFSESLAGNPLLDFTQGRFFQSLPIEATAEQEASIIGIVRRYRALNPGPTLVTAFSLNRWFEPTESDPVGVHVQNTLWAAALAGAAGGGASAWGETYVIPRGLERYYAPLAAFASGVDWTRLDLQPAEAMLISEEAPYQTLRFDSFNRQFRAESLAAVARTLSADGVYPELHDAPGYLYGRVYNTSLTQPQTYIVAVPTDSYIEVGVRGVSDVAGARLSVMVDGQLRAEMSLAASSRPAALRVPLRAGEHTIQLDNTGDDWLDMDYIEVGQMVAPARVLTLRDATTGTALAWIQHRGYTWDQVADEVEREPLLFTYRLDRMPPGRYVVELWDPLTGAVLGEEAVRVRGDGVLRFELSPLTRQLALRIFRVTTTPDPAPTDSPAAIPTHDSPAAATPVPQPTRTRPAATSEPAATRPFVAPTNTPRFAPTQQPD